MDNVLNRPLFRHREARDRLNDIAGVQRFAPGGVISADPSGAIMRQYSQRPVRPVGLATLPSASAGENLSNLRGFQLANAELAATEEEVQRLQQAFEDEPTGENLELYKEGLAALEQQRQMTEGVRSKFIPGSLGVIEPDRDVLAVEGPEAMVSQMSPEQLDIFNNLSRAAETVAPAPTPAPGPSGMEAEARKIGPAPSGMEAEARGSRPPVAGQKPVSTPALGPSAMEADARGRGPLITNPAEVAANLNAEDPAVREKTVSDFMQEFTAIAPKYEGADKNLMLAQIGFAIAAGESPNAMQNIANGLLAGSDAMIKDKAAKAEFDRQLQLSAMQYGLQEVGKQRTRSEQALNFVALEDTVYKGRKVKAGDSVYIPYGEIEKNGGVVPSGFGDSSMVTAINDRAKAVSEVLEKARQENLVDDTFAESQREKFSRAASTAISAERGLGYMESAILKVAEDGNITGLAGTADNLVAQVAAAAGLSDINAQFNSREEVQGLVKKAFQNLIPAALSGVQTANSISNRDIEILADAYVNSMLEDGIFSMATVTEDKLLNSMKGAVDLLESERQQSLVDMGTIEKTLVGRTLRSGDAATSIIEPYRELLPGQGAVSQPRRLGSLSYGEDGIYEIVRPGN
jgi:hypothetical protein